MPVYSINSLERAIPRLFWILWYQYPQTIMTWKHWRICLKFYMIIYTLLITSIIRIQLIDHITYMLHNKNSYYNSTVSFLWIFFQHILVCVLYYYFYYNINFFIIIVTYYSNVIFLCHIFFRRFPLRKYNSWIAAVFFRNVGTDSDRVQSLLHAAPDFSPSVTIAFSRPSLSPPRLPRKAYISRRIDWSSQRKRRREPVTRRVR